MGFLFVFYPINHLLCLELQSRQHYDTCAAQRDATTWKSRKGNGREEKGWAWMDGPLDVEMYTYEMKDTQIAVFILHLFACYKP